MENLLIPNWPIIKIDIAHVKSHAKGVNKPWTPIKTFLVNETDIISAPFVYTLPNQLIAYHIALLKGTDVDQPRNLAKSVTVE